MKDKEKYSFSVNTKIIIFPLFLIIIGFGYVIFNLAVLQLEDPDGYAERAENQQMSINPIEPIRGTIYDRNKTILAKSATAWKVIVSPKSIKSTRKNEVAAALAEILDIDALEVAEKVFKQDSGYEEIMAQVEEPQKQAVERFILGVDEEGNEVRKGGKIGGVYFETDFKRYYPHGTLASTVLGFTGKDQQGLYGLEYQYEEILSGVRGREISVTNVKGAATPFDFQLSEYPAQNGYSLVLTIDENVQSMVEGHLQAAIAKNRVRNRGVAIVIDVNSFEIIAMATEGGFDPNVPFEIANGDMLNQIMQLPEPEQAAATLNAQELQWNNKAINEIYEPGSVFKIITGAASLDLDVVNLNSQFFCPGRNKKEEIAPDVFSGCWSLGHGWQNFNEAMMHSCNPAFMQMGRLLTAHGFSQYFKGFGLHEKTGIDLPGEEIGLHHTEERMGVTQLLTGSFGQTFSITPIQLITAVATSVNGGYLGTPHVVRQVIDDSDNVISAPGTTIKRQVISTEVSKEISQSLFDVVNREGGSGKNAYVEGFRIGGKTGTTQKTETINPETGFAEETISSFAAISPAENPQVAVLLLLDNPYDPNRHASTLAAPIVGEICRDILEYVGVEPKYTEAEMAKQLILVPTVISKETEFAKAELAQLGFTISVQGKGGSVLRQTPTHGQQLARGGTIVIYTEGSGEEDKLALVPDVLNRSPKDARYLLEIAGLNVVIIGGAVDEPGAEIISQSEVATTKIPIGSIVILECIKEDEIL